MKLEQDYYLFSRKIDGASLWQLIRFPVFNRIAYPDSYTSKLGRDSPSSFDRFRFFLSAALRIDQNPIFSGESEALFLAHPRRMLMPDEKWWDLYTDYILEEIAISFAVIERQMDAKHRRPAKTSNLFYLDSLDLLEYLSSKFDLVNVTLSDEEQQLISDLEGEILERFSQAIDLRSLVLSILRIRRIRRPYYKAMLTRMKPKVVIVISSYNELTFIEVAKDMGIPVVELQHGMISIYHTGYSFPQEFHEYVIAPDYLFTFGEYWNSAANYAIDDDRIMSMGFPFAESQMKKIKAKAKDEILFISQWTTGQEIASYAVELSKMPSVEQEIVLKLHPRDCDNWRKRYPQLAESEIRVVDDARVSLYGLFAESSCVVGVYSTAVIEAILFGMNAYLLDIRGIENVSHLIDAGLAKKVSTPEELLNAIECQDRTTSLDKNRFLRPGGSKRIARELEMIASR